jgi:phage gp16-like protein
MSLPDTRRRDLAQIHLAIKQLQMTDADHRALLIELFNVNSSAQLSDRQRGKYLGHLRKLGFKPAPPKARKSTTITRTQDTSPEMRKLRAIWLMMHSIGVVRDPSEPALIAWAKRIGKVDTLQWQQRPAVLIEALKIWAMRHLPAWVEAHIPAYERWCNAHPDEPLARAVNTLRSVQMLGTSALFDYYWPCWEALCELRAGNVAAR